MPRAILYSGLAVVVLYIFGSLGIMMALPLDHINLVPGITDATRPLLGDNSPVVMIITVLFMLRIVGDQVTWSMAPSRAAAEAAPQRCQHHAGLGGYRHQYSLHLFCRLKQRRCLLVSIFVLQHLHHLQLSVVLSGIY